jgi:hypothetical protein
MTRSKTRVGEWVIRRLEGVVLISCGVEPPQFTRVTFPVKALKLLLHELQSNGDAATLGARTAPVDAESDDSVSAGLRLFIWYLQLIDSLRLPEGLGLV